MHINMIMAMLRTRTDWEQGVLYISLIVAAILAAVFVRKYLFFVTVVQSDSMFPALRSKDWGVTLRIHNATEIKRGNILVFYSEELKDTLVKRVIGFPHDHIICGRDGAVYVNGKKLQEPYLKQTEGERSEFRVPAGKYFLMGDNRAHSFDSRSFLEPFISEQDIKGRIIFSLVPFRKI
ncbi:signal peptidase I [Trichococcus ilyis]|uniref:Signal peptidase I n=1 Tax=Trichococcus ilyis TaxID=640938 RepID=A0A143YZZ7_9LACT|nr:signal peptidase I [Trichococcus ilyis]CZR02803.1 peptidase s26a signal peptidase i serine active site [Trichococcus ilyis]SEJ67114.1 signal peptidase I [Trichococcus ilyis]